jgi:hypothetical protein
MNAEKQNQHERLVASVIGMEPYETIFRRIGGILMDPATTKKERNAVRREWFAFMREHVMEYLSCLPEQRDELIEFLENYITTKRQHPSVLTDANVILEVARRTAPA